MSASLVKKALEIFDSTDSEAADKSISKGKTHKSVKVKKRKSSQNLKKKVAGDSRGAALVRKTLEQVKANQDHTDKNLELLLLLSKEKHSKFTSRILEQSGRTPVPKEAPPCETSAFTEEDFAKFEREYFIN